MVPGVRVRSPAVAGAFYPADEATRAYYDEGASLDAVLAEIDRLTRPVLARGT